MKIKNVNFDEDGLLVGDEVAYKDEKGRVYREKTQYKPAIEGKEVVWKPAEKPEKQDMPVIDGRNVVWER